MGAREGGERNGRLPSVPLAGPAVAVAAGVVVDRWGMAGGGWGPVEWGWVAIGAVVGGLVAGWVGLRWGAGLAVLLAFGAVGAGWHHRGWSELGEGDLARFDWSVPRPAWLRGVVVEVPEYRPGGGEGDEGRTRTELEVEGISDGSAWRRASGRVLVYVEGDRSDVRMGEVVRAAGTLQAIEGPLNPGEDDPRERWRAEGIRLRLSVDGPSGVEVEGTESGRWREELLGRLRTGAHERLVAGLGPEEAPLAAALLLGRREAIEPGVYDAFAKTGTMHLLAISGLHMQALAGLLGLALMMAGLGRKGTAAAVGLATVGYAGLVGWMPSVVRSLAMTAMVCLAIVKDRMARPSSLLAFAALLTLACNPAYLFDVGCQLSFVAVMALVWGVPPVARWAGVGVASAWVGEGGDDDGRSAAQRLDALERAYAPRWKQVVAAGRDWVVLMLVSSAVVWGVTLPLVMLRFHLVPVAGIVLNVPLVALSMPTLGAAGLVLLFAVACPPLVPLAAWPTAALLDLTVRLVRWGASWPAPWGYAFTAAPPAWWVVGFYAGLAAAGLATAAGWAWRRPLWGAWIGWAAWGVALVVLPSPPEVPEAEVLAVDHGLAVVVRSPEGKTLLYDCGKMMDPSVGRRVVAPALWALGVRRVDTVVLSHADADHYDGLPDVLARLPVGEVRVAEGFGGEANPGGEALLDVCRSRGVPVRPIAAGDRLELGGGLRAEVLHPPAGWLPGAPDNDRSVVLDLSVGGRHLLLTGDLDGAGTAEILARPEGRFDAVLAPHHGGRSANRAWFYEWAGPGRVVASQRRPPDAGADALTPLEQSGVEVLRTWRDGAVRFRWEGGGLSARGFVEGSRAGEGSSGRAEGVFEGAVLMGLAWVGDPRVAGIVGALAFVAGLVGCVLVGILEFGAWTLVTPGRRHDPSRPDREPAPWEPIAAEAADGARLAGAWRSAPGSVGRTLLLLHGFAEDRSALVGRAEAMAARGWNVAVLDSRGRGQSGGDRTSFGGREADDLRAWVDVVAGRVGPGLRLAVWGRSMGAAIALRGATVEPRIRAVVLEAPYPDLTPTVAAWLRRLRLPGAFAGPMLGRAARLAGVPLASPRPIDLAPGLTVPALIVHGTDDRVASLAESRRLAGAIGGRVEFEEVGGAKHSDVFDVGGERLADRVAGFLEGGVRAEKEN